MLMEASEWIISRLFSDMEDDNQRLTCIYGCELWLYSFISTLGLLLVGILLQAFLETVLMITIFYALQKNGGGFHASSHMKCFAVMFGGLLSGLFLTCILNSHTLFICMLAFSAVVLFTLPLRLHPYKKYLIVNKSQLYARSYLVTICVIVGIIAIGLMVGESLFKAGCSAIFFSAVSRLFAVKS